MKTDNGKLRKIFTYAIPSLISVFLVMVLFAVKHIYPFGNQNIIYSDFAQTTAAAYYHLHDLVWEGKGFLFDFSVGLGASDYGFMTFNGLLSPLSWLTLLVPRSQILNFIPFLFMIKIGLMALTFNIFLNKFFTYKPGIFSSSALSVLYAMSGYTMLYTVIFQFLEAAILFPLILLGLKNLYGGKSFALYTSALALSTICCYYTSIMIILFVLLSSPFAIKMFVLRPQRKKAAASLAYGTLLALMISSFVIIPTYIQISKSIRIDIFKFSKILKAEALASAEQKCAVILPLSIFLCIAAAVILKLARRRLNKEEKRFYLFALFMIIISVMPIAFEPLNLLWHTGSYVLFPYRYGFIATAVLLAVCGYFFGRLEKVPDCGEYKLFNFSFSLSKGQKNVLAIFCIVISSVLLWIVLGRVWLYADNVNSSMPFIRVSSEAFSALLKISLAFAAVFIPLIIAAKYKYMRFLILTVCCIEAFSFSYMYLGVPEGKLSRDNRTDYIETALNFSQTVEFSGGELNRVRDKSLSLNSNYPLIMQRGAVSGWVHFISADNQKTIKSLGYSKVYTRTLDSGGTVFSDALLGVADVISSENQPAGFYTRTDSCDGLGLYSCNYSLPFGMILKGDRAKRENYDISGVISPFKMQNDIYRDITGKDEDIIKIYNAEPQLNHAGISEINGRLAITSDKSGFYDSYIKYSVDVKERQMLYLNISDCYGGMHLLKVEVNGSEIIPKSLSGAADYYYPATWDNGLIELGVFENEKVDISLIPQSSYDYFYLRTVEIGGISEENMKRLSASAQKDYFCSVQGSRISCQTDGKAGEMLLLPISFYDGFSARVNGQKSEVHKVYGNFIGIELLDGENDISISFAPSGFKASVVISLLGLLLFVFCLHSKRIYGIIFACGLQKVIYAVYWTVASAALIFLYAVLPLVWRIAQFISP